MTGVAKEWGRLPSEFGVCDPDMDIAVMIAYTQTRNLMSAYEMQVTEEEAELKRLAKGKK